MDQLAFIGNLGTSEIILIVFVILLLFGAKRLPELARSFGKSLREFKKATSEAEETFRKVLTEEEKAAKPTTAAKEKTPSEPQA